MKMCIDVWEYSSCLRESYVLDQQDLGHYTTREYYHAQPFIFKCEWESIESKRKKSEEI